VGKRPLPSTDSENEDDPRIDSCPFSDEFSEITEGVGSGESSDEWSSEDELPLVSIATTMRARTDDDEGELPLADSPLPVAGPTWGPVSASSRATFPRFPGKTTPALNREAVENPLDAYLQIVDDALFKVMVEETNRYAQQTIEGIG